MAGLSTHVLDTAAGRPAVGVAVVAEHRTTDGWTLMFEGSTDADGRVRIGDELAMGTYRLTFDTGSYYGDAGFHPSVTIEFRIDDAADHYHVPLLVSPFGYTTYRGS